MSRTVMVGDVHGCRSELEALLDRVGFASGDRLVFVGDLLPRGPDSLGVLDVARRSGAVVVRGNHEQKLLDWYAAKQAKLRGEEVPPVRLGPSHLQVAKDLRPVDWSLLETSPIFFDLPDHGVRVVHAGVLPGVAPERTDPGMLMRVRTIRPDGSGSSGDEGVLWGALYRGPPHVVFGHNAAPGLQVHPWATGLDTGCVYGGKLTALVLNEGEPVPESAALRREKLVSVPAARTYVEPSRGAPHAP